MGKILDWIRSKNYTKVHDERRVLVYSRAGCHLCDDAWRELSTAKERLGFQLEKADIDADPELVESYGTCVPVVVVDGKVRFRGRVNMVLFERLFRTP